MGDGKRSLQKVEIESRHAWKAFQFVAYQRFLGRAVHVFDVQLILAARLSNGRLFGTLYLDGLFITFHNNGIPCRFDSLTDCSCCVFSRVEKHYSLTIGKERCHFGNAGNCLYDALQMSGATGAIHSADFQFEVCMVQSHYYSFSRL